MNPPFYSQDRFDDPILIHLRDHVDMDLPHYIGGVRGKASDKVIKARMKARKVAGKARNRNR